MRHCNMCQLKSIMENFIIAGIFILVMVILGVVCNAIEKRAKRRKAQEEFKERADLSQNITPMASPKEDVVQTTSPAPEKTTIDYIAEDEAPHTGWKRFSTFSFIACFLSVGLGLYKLLFYANPEEYYELHMNVYVGGDAYNYIINGTHATAYFVLATMWAIFAIGAAIMNHLKISEDKK